MFDGPHCPCAEAAATDGAAHRCAAGARYAGASYAARLSAARDSAFSFHTSPPTKNSFFQIGTSAFSSSMAQWHACEQAPSKRGCPCLTAPEI